MEQVTHNNPGVVLFDDPHTHTTGWAAVAGQAARQIRSAQELTSANVWLTNLDKDAFSASGLYNNRFRPEDYLRVGLTSLSVEQGVAVEAGGWTRPSGARCAEALADCFGSVMSVVNWLNVSGYPSHQLRCGFRNDDHYKADATFLPPQIKIALAEATEKFTISERRNIKNSDKLTQFYFPRHRYTHAHEVLRQPIPMGHWRSAPALTAQQICEHQRPLLIAVQVHEIEQPLGNIVNFGGSARFSNSRNHVSAPPRRWMTQPEFAFIAPHAKIAVLQILECDTYQQNPLFDKFPPFGALQQVSHACNLAIESYWTTVGRELNGATSVSSIAAWVSAYDRIACIREAIGLQSRDPNIDITGFGYGRVGFRTLHPETELGEWSAAMVRGTILIPPLVEGVSTEYALGDDAKPPAVLQALQLSGNVELISHYDKLALEDFGVQMAVSPTEEIA